MGYTTKSNYLNKIKQREPFRGSSVRGVIEDGLYLVYSYHTPIAAFHDTGWIYFDNKSYSPTTSRIQNLVGGYIENTYGAFTRYYSRDGMIYYKKDFSSDVYCKYIYSDFSFEAIKQDTLSLFHHKQPSQDEVDNPLLTLKNKLQSLSS